MKDNGVLRMSESGATQKQQLFIWHKEHGLLNCRYITFEENSKKKLLKR